MSRSSSIRTDSESDSLHHYLSRHGLGKDPFTPEIDEVFYYASPRLRQRLDLIQHLVEYSSQILLVRGRSGAGKTAMLKQLMRRTGEHWRICHIEATTTLNSLGLLKKLTSSFRLQLPVDALAQIDTYLEALRTHLKAAEQSMLVPALFVDNAHDLPFDAFILLLGLAQPDGSSGRLHVVLFAEPQIKRTLDSPQLQPFKHNIMHHLDIPPFTGEQTREYLEKRLAAAGANGALSLSEATLQRIHKGSAGVPGRINLLARQALLQDEVNETGVAALRRPEKGRPSRPKTRRPYSLWQVIAVGGLLAFSSVLVWITTFVEDVTVPEQAGSVSLNIPRSKAPRAKADEPQLPTGQEHKRTRQTLRTRPSAMTESAAVVAQSAPESTSNERAKLGGGELQRPSPESDVGSVEQPNRSWKAPEPAHTDVGLTAISGIKGESWLRSQPSSRYVLQIFGAHDEDSVVNFLLRHKLRKDVAWFLTEYRGKPWYVIVCGLYADRSAAAGAVLKLPVTIRRLKPWPRSIASIQDALKNKPRARYTPASGS